MKNIAVFIDRDGVINYDPGNFHKINELVVLPRVGEAIRLLNEKDILSIVVTNQSVIARGWITESELHKIHSKIETHIKKQKAKISKFYYCPHHPEGVVQKYRVVCACRKPEVGMFEQASHDYSIDIPNSYIVGDSYREIEAARKLGCVSIAVLCGRSEFQGLKADYTVSDLYEAVILIIKLQRSAQSHKK